MFPLYLLNFGEDQETQASITVLPSGSYKVLRFWNYSFLESAYERLYRLTREAIGFFFDKITF